MIEDLEHTLKVASYFQKITEKLKIPFVFKVSYDKANRSSANSYRGPGIDKGLKWLEIIKKELNFVI